MDRLVAANTDSECLNHLFHEFQLLQLLGPLMPLVSYLETSQTPQMEEVITLRDRWDVLHEQIGNWRSGLRHDLRE